MISNPTGPYSIITREPTILAIGGLLAYGEDLSRFGFIMNVAWEVAAQYDAGSMVQKVVHARLDDTEDPSVVKQQIPEVRRAVGLLRAARAAGHNALVTCAAGRNRSGLVIAEYLISSGLPADRVIKTMQERRKDALTNRAFVKWLMRKR